MNHSDYSGEVQIEAMEYAAEFDAHHTKPGFIPVRIFFTRKNSYIPLEHVFWASSVVDKRRGDTYRYEQADLLTNQQELTAASIGVRRKGERWQTLDVRTNGIYQIEATGMRPLESCWHARYCYVKGK